MKRTLLIFFSILLLIPIHTSAQTSSKSKVLVLYSTEDNKITNNVQILNTQLGHFTKDITVKSLKEVKESTESSSYTYCLYRRKKRRFFYCSKTISRKLLRSHISFRTKC